MRRFTVCIAEEWESAQVAQCFGSTGDFSPPTLETIQRFGWKQRCVEFVHEQIDVKQNTTYVHCKAGRGRSTVVVVAFLIQYRNMTLEEAFELVKTKRPHREVLVFLLVGFIVTCGEHARVELQVHTFVVGGLFPLKTEALGSVQHVVDGHVALGVRQQELGRGLASVLHAAAPRLEQVLGRLEERHDVLLLVDDVGAQYDVELVLNLVQIDAPEQLAALHPVLHLVELAVGDQQLDGVVVSVRDHHLLVPR
ncbi:hypothetical protein ON010_g7088 [Phytophthora cinnamomi]|nr:hypothetical protein ON010_g7088 [Phytophthora cinnamomi]